MPHSQAQIPTLTCPQCEQNFDAAVWLIVDAAERPDLLEEIQQGKLHNLPCPHCGHDGQVDAPLLLYRPAAEPVLLFSPAQETTDEEDREQAAGLLQILHEALGDDWEDTWLEELPVIPRPLLPAALSDDSEAALRQMAEQAEQELERLRREDPEAYRQLEEAARQQAEVAPTEGNSTRARTPPAGLTPEQAQVLADSLVSWIQQETLDDAETYLAGHQADLLTDEAAAIMGDLVLSYPNLADFQQRLARAREAGIDAMYAEIRQQRLQDALQDALQKQGPIGKAVWQFLQMAEEGQAEALLASQAELLLTWDAGNLIHQLLQAAADAGDETRLARWQTRYNQWQAARIGGAAVAAMQPEPTPTLASDTDKGPGYKIELAAFSAVGDNAVNINLMNFGAVKLRWRRPRMLRRDLTDVAVGRQKELDDLHQRLQSHVQSMAVTGRRRGDAISGMPGVGKSTLAALYAQRLADNETYPGGVFWLTLGPDVTTPESVGPPLSRLAALAYSDEEERLQVDLPGVEAQTLAQIQQTIKGAIFTPEVTQRMLGGHGRLLVVVDDVWERQILPAIRQALPEEAQLLVTTRDDRVARAVGEKLSLDVLSPDDALALIWLSLPQMPKALAQKLIRVVGAHPMALQIALGDLNPDDPADEWEEAIDQIAGKLAQGLGVDPSTLSDISPEKRLEGILPVSYEALTNDQLRSCFRTLGSFAPEATFATEALAAVTQNEARETKSLLKVLRDRNLLRRLTPDAPDRWQQHTILRSFALSLQAKGERLAWAERHAGYYLNVMRRVDDDQTYYTMTSDLPQLRHAFAWAVGEEGRALGLAQALVGNCANLLQSQNLGGEYLAWARKTWALAQKMGGREDQGRAWGSLGNALQNTATLIYGEDRAARLQEALAAYDAALERLRDVPLDYATTQNNRANVLRDLASLPGEDRAARLQEALAAYDAALELRRDVPLDYAQTQNNRAVLLRDLASLPGEDRAARLQEAVQEMVAAWPVLATQAAHLLQIARFTLAQLAVVMGGSEFRSVWLEAAGQPPPPIPLDLLLPALARQEGLDSQETFAARLKNDVVFQQQVEALAALTGEESTAPAIDPDAAQALADHLITWIQMPDWAQSRAFLTEHTAELLSDEAEQVLMLLQASNPQNQAIPQYQLLLARCRESGIEAAYREFLTALPAADPLPQALAALLAVDNAEELARAVEEYPLLGERSALERLAGAAIQAQADGEAGSAGRLLFLLLPLLDVYHHAHAEAAEPEEQRWFVNLHEQLLAVANNLEQPELAAALNQSLGLACNTLGNCYADAGTPEEAVAVYSRGLAAAPDNAMLYRNRAGEYIEFGDAAAARADIATAARLEPEAARMPQLRRRLAEISDFHLR